MIINDFLKYVKNIYLKYYFICLNLYELYQIFIWIISNIIFVIIIKKINKKI